MEMIKKNVNVILIVTSCTIFSLCTHEESTLFAPETSVQANVVWMLNGIIQSPSEVSSVRITITSLCDNVKTTSDFPFSLKSAPVATVATGCQFSLLFEGLDVNKQTLYKGEIANQTAIGPSVSVRITAQACTPAPPDSLKAVPAGKRIRLSWTDRSNNETGFIVKRSLSNQDSYLTLDTTTDSFYIDSLNIKRGYPYDYRVYSFNNIGLSTVADSIDKFTLSANTRPHFISTVTDMDSIAEPGKVYIDTIRFMDSDAGDSLWVSLLSTPRGVSIKDSIITWTPDSAQAGQRFTLLTTVTDQDLSRDSLTWSIKVMGTAITSFPPVFSVNKLDLDTSLLLGQLYSETLKATDPENQPLTYKLLSAPHSATIDSVAAIVKWQTDSLGRFEFAASVLDATAKSDTVFWSVIVSKP
jgi:hypothetical protein